MTVEIRKEPFDPWREIAQYQQQMQSAGKYGATACFVGTMRDFNEGEQVSAMTLDYYPGMTDRHLEMICKEAGRRWDLIDILLLHRVGNIAIGEPIVLVAVWSAHRAAAFDACRFIIEDLKSRAPFWKQETIETGKRWVDKNTPG
jgi:molybdopterin synthase catalytic subunit